MKIDIGCDPDSDKSGIAVYRDGKLTNLKSCSLTDCYSSFEYLSCSLSPSSIKLHIEDLNGISANTFNIKKDDPLAVKLKKAENVGKCKQAQIEIERIAEYFGIEIVRHKVSSKWKDSKSGRAELKRLTGWDGQSNPDTRSAAYFGYLGSR